MSDTDATRKRHRVADPLREYADVVRTIIELPHLVYVDDTLRERLLEIADQIDRDHERRMDQARSDMRKAACRYMARVVEDYKHGRKWQRKEYRCAQ